MASRIIEDSIRLNGLANLTGSSHTSETVDTFTPAPVLQARAKNSWEYQTAISDSLTFGKRHTFKLSRVTGFVSSFYLEVVLSGDGLASKLGSLAAYHLIDRITISDGQDIDRYTGQALAAYTIAFNQHNEVALEQIIENAGGDGGLFSEVKLRIPIKIPGCSRCIFSGDNTVDTPMDLARVPQEFIVNVEMNDKSKICVDDTAVSMNSCQLKYKKWEHSDVGGLVTELNNESYVDFEIDTYNFKNKSLYSTYTTFGSNTYESDELDSAFLDAECTAMLISAVTDINRDAKNYLGTGIDKARLKVNGYNIYEHEDLSEAKWKHMEFTGKTNTVAVGANSHTFHMLPLSRTPLDHLEHGVNFRLMHPSLELAFASADDYGVPVVMLFKARWARDSAGHLKRSFKH